MSSPIIQLEQPQLDTSQPGTVTLQLRGSGPPGSMYELQGSTGLNVWHQLQRFTSSGEDFEVMLQVTDSERHWFYRVLHDPPSAP